MTHWEYRTVRWGFNLMNPAEGKATEVYQEMFEKALNELGKDGWEFVAISRNETFIFKRQR